MQFVFFLILISISNLSLSQSEKIDSLRNLLEIDTQMDTNRVNRLNLLSKQYRSVNLDSAEAFAEKSIALSGELKFNKGLATAYNALGNALYYQGKFEEAIDSYDKTISIRSELNDLSGVAAARMNKSSVIGSMGDIPLANEELEKVLDIYRALDDSTQITSILNNLGYNLTILNLYDRAFAKLSEGLAMSRLINNQLLEGMILSNLATLAVKTDYFQHALQFATEAKKIFEDENFVRGLGVVEGIISGVYKELNELDLAIQHYSQAIDYSVQIGDKHGYITRLTNLGAVYFEQGNNDSAFYYLRKGI